MPRTARYSHIDNHNPWFPITGISPTTPARNTPLATTADSSMPRVCVMPMKMPSHTNAATPAAGISHAHHTYSRAARTTVSSSVNSRRKGMPPTTYSSVNATVIPAPQTNSLPTTSRKAPASRAPQ